MHQPLVSIIVPTYNVERYVEECLDSILNQTYSNLEIIVIDDGSTDATPYLLEPYRSKLSLTLNKTNQGQGAVRNQGIKAASGEYILFVDSDDWIEPKTVSSLVQKAIQTEADLVRFNGQSFFEGGTAISEEGKYDFSAVLSPDQIYSNEESLVKNQKAYSASPCLYLVRKDLLEEHRILFPEGILHEDEYFTTQVFLHTKRMCYVDQAYYHRRYRVASTMTEQTPLHKKRSFESYLKVFKLLENEYQSDQYTEKQKNFLKRQLLSIYNGLQQSKVEPELKKELQKLKTISLKDKLRINLSRLRQYMTK
ncbi:glycosyltransferase family 2 protein [Marinilactibacillus piezotolerans]|uniref:glycosyltransferase family 2 protein n=1 Tax=Marinilactibacillus piezotolerans TaxID=258723 RepID=UPI0009B119A7|nr:glycosyltransferase [Marinilactibacillus piezotolerans]